MFIILKDAKEHVYIIGAHLDKSHTFQFEYLLKRRLNRYVQK
jgi:hypothetical protein